MSAEACRICGGEGCLMCRRGPGVEPHPFHSSVDLHCDVCGQPRDHYAHPRRKS